MSENPAFHDADNTVDRHPFQNPIPSPRPHPFDPLARAHSGSAAQVRRRPEGASRGAPCFQPVGVFVFLLTALFLGGTGTIALGTFSLFLIGLPAVACASH
jgi:hypothetical protein